MPAWRQLAQQQEGRLKADVQQMHHQRPEGGQDQIPAAAAAAAVRHLLEAQIAQIWTWMCAPVYGSWIGSPEVCQICCGSRPGPVLGHGRAEGPQGPGKCLVGPGQACQLCQVEAAHECWKGLRMRLQGLPTEGLQQGVRL